MDSTPARTRGRRTFLSLAITGAGLLLLGVVVGVLATRAAGQQGSFPRPPALGLSVNASVRTFCWREGNVGLCADGIPPKCGQPGVPTIMRRPGQRVELQLGFPPSELTLTWHTRSGRAKSVRPTLAPRISWAVPPNVVGVVSVFARAQSEGDASYAFCLRRG